MSIAIWAPYINDAKEEVLVYIKHVVLQTKYGVRLTTTTKSTIDTIENDDIVVDCEQIPATKELVVVLSIKYNCYKAFGNIICKKSGAFSWRDIGDIFKGELRFVKLFFQNLYKLKVNIIKKLKN